MGYCDDLLTTLEALLAATTALECCGDQDITDGKQYTDEIVDGVGDVPQNIIDAGYADDAADWDGFDDYKCMISHLAVDHVESFFREISPHISDTGIIIGGIGVVGALVGAILTVIGLPISAGIIVALGASAAIWTWITSEGRDAVDDLADEIAVHHDALACAIYNGDGVSDSVSDFNTEVDSLFGVLDAVAIKALNIEPQLRGLYAGRYDTEDLAQKLSDLGYDVGDFDCSCVIEYDVEIEYDFTAGSQSFSGNARAEYVAAFTYWNDEAGWVLNAAGGHAAVLRSVPNIISDAGEEAMGPGDSFYIEFMEFDWIPGIDCRNVARIAADIYYAWEDFDHEQAGTYSKSWSPGNEPEMAEEWNIGFGSPGQGGPTGEDQIGMVFRLFIGGHVAPAS